MFPGLASVVLFLHRKKPFARTTLKKETGAVFRLVFPQTTHWPHYGGGGGVNARPAFKDR